MTKPLNGTAVRHLVEAGLLDLDLPIAAYLPRLQLGEESIAERVTLRTPLSPPIDTERP